MKIFKYLLVKLKSNKVTTTIALNVCLTCQGCLSYSASQSSLPFQFSQLVQLDLLRDVFSLLISFVPPITHTPTQTYKTAYTRHGSHGHTVKQWLQVPHHLQLETHRISP